MYQPDDRAHLPVLLKEMLEYLNPSGKKVIVDCTFGAGGYSKAILEANDSLMVYSIDRDPEVGELAKDLELKFGSDRFQLLNGNFGDIASLLKQNGINKVDGIVVDLGVSSMQLDNDYRGFSFLKDAKLDMRMNNKEGVSAEEFINSIDETNLANIIFKYGEERLSRRIAKKIIEHRISKPIETTIELANIVRSVVPRGGSKIDPATKTFQAIRIYLNDELCQLEQLLKSSVSLLNTGGRLVIVSFHSLEDSIIKNFINDNCAKKVAISKYSKNKSQQEEGNLINLTRKVIAPTQQEIKLNIRARSAKLRAAERTDKISNEGGENYA
jgi:16S rRNA (cytosine1402-N4)-methyltransferase